ncbi:MAG: DUF2240 family protein [Candidatus Thermoplasmatota archaeon]|jgi:hypothetical protein|nr:DUF2240 family protein [Candidatus Thermoplasmatota archaeon]
MDPLKQTIAFLYHKKGVRPLKRMEMEITLSMDLRWFTLAQSKLVVERAVLSGYVAEKEGLFLPTFSMDNVEIPPLFRPSFEEVDQVVVMETTPDEVKAEIGDPPTKILEKPREKPSKKSLFDRILDHVMKAGGYEKRQVIRRMNELKELDVIPEIRLLILARGEGIDVSEFLNETDERIRGYL